MEKQTGIKAWLRDLPINSRIVLSAVFGILVPVIAVLIFGSVFMNSITSYLNLSTVTTNSYSTMNMIQWNQTVGSISNELISLDSPETKKSKVEGFVTELEKFGTQIYIDCNGEEFYTTSDKASVKELVNSILPGDTDMNTNYFGENGMVIITHAESTDGQYLVIIANKNYSVGDISSRNAVQDFSAILSGKTGMIFMVLIGLLIISNLLISFITSKTIIKPVKKLAEGANEISRGNLDYRIDYESANEIGTTVKAFNHMTIRLRESLNNLERLENSRKEMIAGAAHDLRTPLTSVKGYVEGLRDGIANTPEMQERYLKTIYSSTLAMEKMLDDLLTVSRLELGQIQLETELINLNDYLDDCAGEISLELEKEGFDFVYENDCENPLFVEIDPINFKRVINNVISNSIKYARKDVKGRFVLSAQSYKKSVIISLSDNGAGVDAQSLGRIFEAFYRADKSRTHVTEGSGIGLSVCKQIVELHNGHIWATSTEDKGLTIHISLEKKAG